MYILDEGHTGRKLVFYQLFIRLFGNKNISNVFCGSIDENGVGKFSDINDAALTGLKNMGVTHIWYTGAIEHATTTDYSAYGIKRDNPRVVKGRAGSPYAIKDYYDVDPDLAVDINLRMDEFEALLRRTHFHGLKAIIDFVPNHVARHYHSDARPTTTSDPGQNDNKDRAFDPGNNFYYLPGERFVVPEGEDPCHSGSIDEYVEFPAKASGNNVFNAAPSFNDWFETVKLNYGVDPSSGKDYFDPPPDTWEKMLAILVFWAAKGVDGFRCDMAELVPVEFWRWAIPRIRSDYPGILFIAEIYNPARYRDFLDKGSFDFLYDKVQLYDTLKSIVRGEGITDRITSVWKDLEGINSRMLRFLENHDEQRIASPYFAGDPFRAIPAMVVCATLYRGPVMIYFGQETGETAGGATGFSGDDGRTSIFDYCSALQHQNWVNGGLFDGGGLTEDQRKLRSFYGELLNLVNVRQAFRGGKFFDLHTLNRENNPSYRAGLYSYLRYTGDESLVVITWFNDSPVEANILVPQELAPSREISIIAGNAGAAQIVRENENVRILTSIPPWGYGIFE